MKNLIIIGIGGFAREVYWHTHQTHGFGTEFKIKGFIDGDVKLEAEEYKKLPENVPVLGDVDSYEICADDVFSCAIGTPSVRRKLVEKILSRGGEFINLISRDAYIIPTARLGQGIILASRTLISDHAEVGDFAVMNHSSILGHDAKLGKYSCIMSMTNITGGAEIGDEVFIASSATVTPKVIVEKNSYIGAGSVVVKRVRAGKKVFGNPAIEI